MVIEIAIIVEIQRQVSWQSCLPARTPEVAGPIPQSCAVQSSPGALVLLHNTVTVYSELGWTYKRFTSKITFAG